jgi:inosine/xanthosine triphosphate pyrophosphatase family protein
VDSGRSGRSGRAYTDRPVPEIQGTTQEVALAKVKAAAAALGAACVTEDTALGFEALGGLPGPYIKDFLETVGHDGKLRWEEMRALGVWECCWVGVAGAAWFVLSSGLKMRKGIIECAPVRSLRNSRSLILRLGRCGHALPYAGI